jgi:hypothetical protein
MLELRCPILKWHHLADLTRHRDIYHIDYTQLIE